MTLTPIHTILHPTDFSADSTYAFQMARSLARDYGARLIVLHVIPPPSPPVWAGDAMIGAAGCWPEGGRDEVDRMLGELQAESPDVRVEHQVREGDPADRILAVAEAEHADLIVMGSRGKSALERLLMGSVAEQVMRRGRCPILAVRPAKAEPADVAPAAHAAT